MSVIKRIAKNTLALVISSVTCAILGMLYGIYTARYLGADGFGVISLAIAFMSLFSIFSDLGLQQLMVREVARDHRLLDKYLGNVLFAKIFLVILAYALILITINLLNYPALTIRIVSIIGLSMVCGAFTGAFNSIFQALERMEYVSFGSILNSALMLAGGIYAVSQRLPVIAFALIYSISSIIVLIYALLAAIKIGIPLHVYVDRAFILSTLRRALPFGVGSLFLVYYIWIDRVILSYLMDNSTVGYYSAAYNIMGVFSFVPTAFVTSLFPVMSRSFGGSRDSLSKIFQKGIKFLFLLALPMATGVTLLGDKIVGLIYGPGFLLSEKPLTILIWAEFLIFLDVLLGNVLLSINKERWTMMSAGLGALLNIILNLLLIPKFGMLGAAFATFSTELFFFVFAIYLLSRYGYDVDIKKLVPKPLFATAVMSLFILKLNYLPLFLLIPSSALLYFSALFLTKYLSDDDIQLIRTLISFNRHGGNV